MSSAGITIGFNLGKELAAFQQLFSFFNLNLYLMYDDYPNKNL